MHKHSILALALLAAASASQAGEVHRAANREISLSVGAQQLDYAEYGPMDLTADGINNPQRSELDSEHGGQGAEQFSIGFQGDLADVDNLYARLDLTTGQGETRYSGYLQDSFGNIVAPWAATTKVRVSDLSLKLGKAFDYSDDLAWQFTPYMQLGARNWVRDLEKPYGYREDDSHQSAGLGLLSQWAVARTVVSVDVNGSKLLNARMVIPEYDAEFVLGDAEFVLHGSISIDFAVGQRGHLLASYQYEQFSYGVSPIIYIRTVDGFALEPDSETRQQRLFVGFAVNY